MSGKINEDKGAGPALTLEAARREILAIIARIPTQELPRFKIEEDGCLWFKNLSMGWHSATHPERMAEFQTHQLFAAESASREFQRKARLVVADSVGGVS